MFYASALSLSIVGQPSVPFVYESKHSFEKRGSMVNARKRFALLITGLILAVVALPVGAQSASRQSVANAHRFLTDYLGRGTTKVLPPPVGMGDLAVLSYSGADCSSQITFSVETEEWDIHIDWSRVSDVTGGNLPTAYIGISGALNVNGSIVNLLALDAESPSVGNRIAKAMEYLRVKCEADNPTGF
jgi:hypothetical protein